MSFNQSTYQKNDHHPPPPQDPLNTGRSSSFNPHRSYSKGGNPSASRSFKKSGGNATVAGNAHQQQSQSQSQTQPQLQSRVRTRPNPSPSASTIHAHSPPEVPSPMAQPSDTSSTSNRSGRPVPKPPTSRLSAVSSDATSPAMTVKGDASSISVQFGSITPGFVNGMQVPARTSSAPPNLDEQRCDQAGHDPMKSNPPVPLLVAPKQQLPKNMGVVDKTMKKYDHAASKAMKDQVLPISSATVLQKHAVHPMPGPIPFHQSSVPLQFSGPNQQIQSQGSMATPIQYPISLPIPPGVQQQMFVPGLQPHSLQPHAMMHQGPGLNFGAPISSQLPPQLGNLGMGVSSYSSPQGPKFGGPRKSSVRITHPETRQEVRLDKRTDTFMDGSPSTRAHSNFPPQSQPIASYSANHSVNFYPNYGPGPLFYSAPSSVPLASSQMTPNSQAPRFNHNTSQGPQTMQMESSQDISVTHNKGSSSVSGSLDSARPDHAHDKMRSGLVVAQGTLKPETGFNGDNVMDISPKISATVKIIEPTGVSRNYVGSPSDSCILPRDTPLKPKPVSGSVVSLLGKTKEVAPASGAVSISDDSPSIRAMSAEEGSAELLSNASSDAGGRRDDLMMSNLKDGKMILGENGQNSPDSKVHKSSKDMSGSHALTSPSGGGDSEEVLKGSTSFSSECIEEDIAATISIYSAVSKASDAADGADDTAVATPVSHEHSKPDDTNIKGELLSGVAAKTEPEHSHPTERLEDSADQSEISSVSLQCSESAMETDGEVRSRQSFEKDERTFDDHSFVSEISGLNEERYCINHEKGVNNSFNSGISGPIPYNIVSSLPACGSPSLTDTSTTGGITTGSEVVTGSAFGSNPNLPENNVGSMGSLQATTGGITTGSEVVTGSAFGSNPNLPENNVGSMGSLQATVLKETSALDAMKAKGFAPKGKKKRKEILQKADAAGATSDLYLAYKGPEDNKEIAGCQDKEITSPDHNSKPLSAEGCGEGSVVSEDSERSKAEPDDWEDVADISTTKLESANAGRLSETSVIDVQTGCPVPAKKYSRDFLLKFVDECRNLPENFVITSDIAEAFIPSLNSSYLPNRDSHHSPGRVDRQSGGPRLDRRLSGLTDDERWSKPPGPFAAGQNMHLDVGFGMNVGIRPGHGGNHGVLRNPRVQTPVPYLSGLLSGPMQSLGFQGGLVRNSPDADRWQRAAGFQQKGLIPSPHTPLQVMHKAERKYEVGKVTDEEEAKQRQLKGILNKLTPQNFEKLFEQVKAVNIDNASLTGLISQIFDKALMEPTFCEMYADLCCHLAQELPDFSDDNEKITFKRLLLNKCQEEFERGEREQEEADKVNEEGEVKLSEEGREEKRIKARRRMLGNIRLIGELYKKRMLTEKIMHECIKKLLGQYQTPHEEDIEALCKLMSTIGEMIDHPKARDHIDMYFERMQMLSNNMSLSSRVRFMLKDSIELRKRKWQQRRKVEGPKKIEEVHRDAAQERQAQVVRLGSRTPATNPSARRADFSSRVSNVLSSPAAPIGGFRGSQVRGYGNQDVRFGEGQHVEARPLTVPLPQRHMGDDSSITLGPQGGLGRGMSFRGQPSSLLNSATDTSRTLDSRRSGTGLNGLSLTENTGHGSRADTMASTERFPGRPAYNQYRMPDPDDSSAVATSPSSHGQDRASSGDMPFEKKWPEERLRDMSIAAIREFYSAKDENEVALCIKDLKSVSFYPSMVSVWVTDSFERKAVERDLLANLLVNLTRLQDGILSQVQLIKGFESALQSLEDAVNDAPKAPEFLGCIFGKAIAENTVSLREIGQIILQGGEEPGGLLEAGLAVLVLESTLEMIKSLKGETVLDVVWTSSNLRLEDFRPSDPIQSKLLGRFM